MSKPEKKNWAKIVLDILISLPMIVATAYFMKTLFTAINTLTNDIDSLSVESFNILYGGILLTAMLNSVKKFVAEVIAHHPRSHASGDSQNEVGAISKALLILKMIFVAAFAGFWSVGFTMASFAMEGDIEPLFRVALGAAGAAGCAVWIGYFCYGILTLQKKFDNAKETETIAMVIFAIAWTVYVISMGSSAIGYYSACTTEACRYIDSTYILAFFIMLFGPLVYLAQKCLFRLILKLLKKKWSRQKTEKLIGKTA